MNLKECYDEVRRLDPNLDVDSLEVAEEVNRIRKFWKPETVKIVLLAESHVYTRKEDFVRPWKIRGTIYHGQFVRFVYCLGYGEDSLVPYGPQNPGTSQFWKIFYSCVHRVSSNGDFGPILHSTPSEKRISNKIQLLSTLKQAGVWLMDASIVGVNHVKSLTLRKHVLQRCWRYTRSIIQDLDPRPEQMIVIGCFVKNSLKDEIDSLGIKYTTLPQPQARLLGGYRRFYDAFFQLSSRPGTDIEIDKEWRGCKE